MTITDALHNSRFLKAVRRETVDTTPLWIMRQAGRYLPEYMAVRSKVTFMDLCKTPELSCEVTVTAQRVLGVDAAILFADLLPILEPMGIHLEYQKGEGPVIHNPLHTGRDVDRIHALDSMESVDYVFQAIRLIRRALPKDIPLIGFAGAPFTLASYCVEGGGSKNYVRTKSLMYNDESAWNVLMSRLVDTVILYLQHQIEAGCQCVQVFDSWAGCLSPSDYRRYVLPHTKRLIQSVQDRAPVINFLNGNPALLPLQREAGGHVMGIDWRSQLDEAWQTLGHDVAIQGNMDPVSIYAELPVLKQRVADVLNLAAGRPGHIFNLGHGVMPDMNPDHVKAVVDYVHELGEQAVTESVPGTAVPTPLRIAVIGGGITGLAAAQRLVKSSDNVRVMLLESSRRLGGIIRTEAADGFLMELGPDSFITNKPAAIQLCEEIGFSDQLIPTDAGFRRSLVLRNGKPMPVPDGFMLMAPSKPWAILTTPILSWTGRLRLLSEAFVARRTTDEDETLASFVRRRFGQQTLDRLVQPLVGGIYTADPEKLSLKATMPRFPEMEQSHGSVIRATLAQRKTDRSRAHGQQNDINESSGSGARYGLFATAAGGLSDMVAAIERTLIKSGRVEIQLGVEVTSIKRSTASDSHWVVQLRDQRPMAFDAVIVTLPTHAAARILNPAIDPELCAALQEIEYASSAIVVSGHQLSDFSHPMDAFGLVVPVIERRKILAVSFSSRKFPNRAPAGQILLRTFVGGAMQPELLNNDDDTIAGFVNEELRSIFGMKAEPLFSEVIRYNNAMPQYHLGHIDHVARIGSLLKKTPGLHLAGSAYTGVGIPDSIASGWSAADCVCPARDTQQ